MPGYTGEELIQLKGRKNMIKMTSDNLTDELNQLADEIVEEKGWDQEKN